MTKSNGDLNWIANYIWGIADDVLRDLYVRGKYQDVILPMTALRRLDAVLEGSKQAVLDVKASLDGAGVVEQDPAVRQTAGQAFYDTSRFTLRDLRARANRQQLTADFTAYLDGFSPNVQDILDNFEFRDVAYRFAAESPAKLPPPISRYQQVGHSGPRHSGNIGTTPALLPSAPIAYTEPRGGCVSAEIVGDTAPVE